MSDKRVGPRYLAVGLSLDFDSPALSNLTTRRTPQRIARLLCHCTPLKRLRWTSTASRARRRRPSGPASACGPLRPAPIGRSASPRSRPRSPRPLPRCVTSPSHMACRPSSARTCGCARRRLRPAPSVARCPPTTRPSPRPRSPSATPRSRGKSSSTCRARFQSSAISRPRSRRARRRARPSTGPARRRRRARQRRVSEEAVAALGGKTICTTSCVEWCVDAREGAGQPASGASLTPPPHASPPHVAASCACFASAIHRWATCRA